MVRILEQKIPVLCGETQYDGSVYYVEAAGNSEDDKPTEGVMEGSKFLETDTGYVWYYSETSGWHKKS